MATHATTKFRWGYIKKDGEELKGAFFVPIGEEDKARIWLKKIVSSELADDERYDPGAGYLEDMGDQGKTR